MKYVHIVGSRGSPETDLAKQRRLIQLVEANYRFTFGGSGLDLKDQGDLQLSFFETSGFQIEPHGDSFIKNIQFRELDGLHKARIFRASPNEIGFYLKGREICIKYGNQVRITSDLGDLAGNFEVDTEHPRLANLPELVYAGPGFLRLLSEETPYCISFRK